MTRRESGRGRDNRERARGETGGEGAYKGTVQDWDYQNGGPGAREGETKLLRISKTGGIGSAQGVRRSRQKNVGRESRSVSQRAHRAHQRRDIGARWGENVVRKVPKEWRQGKKGFRREKRTQERDEIGAPVARRDAESRKNREGERMVCKPVTRGGSEERVPSGPGRVPRTEGKKSSARARGRRTGRRRAQPKGVPETETGGKTPHAWKGKRKGRSPCDCVR